ncbi:MAG: hypothetical protein GX483_01250 [Actinomycetaceae bacterium]|nr:hypothetical protein [Actinomycetaceae bacterium]
MSMSHAVPYLYGAVCDTCSLSFGLISGDPVGISSLRAAYFGVALAE